MFSISKKAALLIIPLTLCLFFACSDDDSTSSGTGDLAGKYVGVIIESGYDTPGEMDATDFGFVGETFAVEVTDNLMLVVNENSVYNDEVSLQLTEATEDTYTGAFIDNEVDYTLTHNFTITYNEDLAKWQAGVELVLDSGSDGDTDDTGLINIVLEQRLDWSEYPTEWAVANSYTDGNTGFVELEVMTAALGAEGIIHGLVFYNDGDSIRARQYISDSPEVLTIVIQEMNDDYIRFSAIDQELPSTTITPDPEDWNTDAGLSDVHLIPTTRMAGFVADEDTITVESQADYDTDGQDGGSTYSYFGANITGVEVTYTINNDGTMDTEMGGDPETRDLGYMEFSGIGYLVSPRIDTSGNDLDVSYLVMELDASGNATGDGLIQGYDIPDTDLDGELDDDEAENIDNEGVAVFGDGLDPDLFDFITTTIPTL